MRFPPKSYNKELESAEDRREWEAQDLELAKEMAEDDDEAYRGTRIFSVVMIH